MAKGRAKEIPSNLQFLLAFTIYRMVLADELLEQIGIFLSRPQRRVLDNIRIQLTEKFERQLESALRDSQLIKADSLQVSLYERFYQVIRGNIIALNKLNELINQFSTTPNLPIEFFAFLNEMRPMIQYRINEKIHPIDESVVLFNKDYSYERADLITNAYLNIDDIILIPYLDVCNPLMWPCLLHEYGHVVARDFLEIVTTPKDEAEIKKSCLAELFSDIFATKRMDTSFIFATIAYFNALGTDEFKSQGSHPNLTFRLEIMLKSLRAHGPYSAKARSVVKRTINHAFGRGVPAESKQLEFRLNSPSDVIGRLLTNTTGDNKNVDTGARSIKLDRVKLSEEAFRIYNSINWNSEYSESFPSRRDLAGLIREISDMVPIPSMIGNSAIEEMEDRLVEQNVATNISQENHMLMTDFRKDILNNYREKRLSSIGIINVAWQAFMGPISERIILLATGKKKENLEQRILDIKDICSGFNKCILKSIDSSQLVGIWEQYNHEGK